MGSHPHRVARFEAAVHAPSVQAWRDFESYVDAVVWIAAQVVKAPDEEYALATVRDSRGVLMAACDNRDRTWTEVVGPASMIADWRAEEFRV